MISPVGMYLHQEYLQCGLQQVPGVQGLEGEHDKEAYQNIDIFPWMFGSRGS